MQWLPVMKKTQNITKQKKKFFPAEDVLWNLYRIYLAICLS